MKAWLHQHRAAFVSALRRLAAAPLGTALSLLAIGVALALPAGGQLLLHNGLQLAQMSAPTPQLSVFMALDADPKAVRDAEQSLKKDPALLSVQLVAREQTLERMKAVQGLGEVIDALEKNPFPDAFILTPVDNSADAMENLARQLRDLPGVEHVQLDSAWAARLAALLRLGRSSVNLLAVLLGAGLIAITFNTIRLQILTHQAEIDVGRLLGATDPFLRRPFYYFGTLQGLLGGLTAWLIVLAATLLLRAPVTELAKLYAVDYSPSLPTLTDMLMWLGFAAALGWAGAGLSLRQYMRQD